MTIINNIEIDNIEYKTNELKEAILNNDPIESKLHVIIVVSNPCLYARRYILAREFIKRMELDETCLILYIVEFAYGSQKFLITDTNNIRHLQVRVNTPIWHKENMINIGVRTLLPTNWKAFAWIDADIEFENNSWAIDTLKILNGCKDVVQVFSHCIDMNADHTNLNIFNSTGYSFNKNKKYTSKGIDYWHPGYAWAITRKAYEKIGGLYDKGVLGSGDNIMALSFINKCKFMNNIKYSVDYNNSMLEYQTNASKLRLGYVPGVIRHHYHGSKINRRYTERWKILMKYNYSHKEHLTYDNQGILIPTEKFSQDFKDDIMNYFRERKEDE